MPEFLEKYLATLKDEDADDLWMYLVGDSNAIHEMIKAIVQIDQLHRDLVDQKEEHNKFKAKTVATYVQLMKAIDDTMDLIKKTAGAMDKVTKKYPIDSLWNVN